MQQSQWGEPDGAAVPLPCQVLERQDQVLERQALELPCPARCWSAETCPVDNNRGQAAGEGMAKRPSKTSSTSTNSKATNATEDTVFGGSSYLDDVLNLEFEKKEAGGSGRQVPPPSSVPALQRGATATTVSAEIQNQRPFMQQVVDHRAFIWFYMILTMYALLVPDLDMCLGNKASGLVFRVITTIVAFLFVLEIICQGTANSAYWCKTYFWLDVISFISLLPDTYVGLMLSGNAFVAGRSSKITRILRVTSRAKAARFNRVIRIARVARIVPYLQRMFSRPGSNKQIEELLEKKLKRIFRFLDDDMDGKVTSRATERCLRKLARVADEESTNNSLTRWASKKMIGKAHSETSAGGEEVGMGGKIVRGISSGMSRINSSNRVSDSPIGRVLTSGASTAGALVSSFRSHFRSPSKQGADTGGVQDLSYAEFRSFVLQDASVHASLRKSCQHQLKGANNLHNIIGQSSEYVGVKVAFGVLLVLFVLTLIVNRDVEDVSDMWGLRVIERLARPPHHGTQGAQVPRQIREQLEIWADGGPSWDAEARTLLYLDLDKKVYCNEFIDGGQRCEYKTAIDWGSRTSLERIDENIRDSDYRLRDLTVLRLPDLADEDISAAELEGRTMTVAVVNQRSYTESVARISMLTTSLVIFIIVLGILALTKDLSVLWVRMLKPVSELTDDMESITRLQLAGVAATPANGVEETTEMRLIRGTFETMKRSIRQWGKYVPWPVLQHLVHQEVQAELGVHEEEVSIFFSDIASFTTIVEGLPPEQSLLLLSRYFRDMSAIIDDSGGIVIEFIGDAIQSVYGAPVKNKNHPMSAVKSAVNMLLCLDGMNKWSKEQGLPEVSVRCGVHTGRVLVGNMGLESRMKYGVVGEESEVPATLEELNKTYSTKLLVSEMTHSRLRTDFFITRPVDFVHLKEGPGEKGEKRQPIYQVLGFCTREARNSPAYAAAALHTSAMEDYRNGNFEQAAEGFESVSEKMRDHTGEDDVPSVMMLQRCQDYMRNPPPPEWDGY